MVVTDASSTGFAYYIGVPWTKPQARSLQVGLWTPAQSVASSNWRECYTLVLCLRDARLCTDLRDAFIVFVSDNACAVAMATHLFSPTTSIQLLASELRSRLVGLGGQSVGVHLPGALNHYAYTITGRRTFVRLTLAT